MEKKILKIVFISMLLASVSILLPSMNAISKKQSETNLLDEKIHISKPIIIDRNGEKWLKINETHYFLKEKKSPILPKLTKIYILPFGSVIVNISCNEVEKNSFSLNETKKGNNNYINKSKKLFPENNYEYNVCIGLNGMEHVTYLIIDFFPVRYSFENNSVEYTNMLNVSIEYALKSNSNEKLDEYDLLIISPKTFSNNLEKLVEHKEKNGMKTKLVTTNSIYELYDGIDKPEKIKNFIKYAVEQWGVTYVLLVGGMKNQIPSLWHIPVRNSFLDDHSNIESSFISDLYYADVYKYDDQKGYTFENWDSNDNGIFAEWNQNNTDILDLYPDVYVGRLPCRNKIEVISTVNKIIRYEAKPFDEWFNNFVVIGGDTIDEKEYKINTTNNEGQLITEEAIRYMDGFNPIRVWTEDGDVDLTSRNIIKTLNQGQGFVYISGHSNPRNWITYNNDDFKNKIKISLNDIKKIHNKNKLPVLIVGGCNSCKFDVSLLKILNINDILRGDVAASCWGWTFVKSQRGGSIATIGSTGLCYGAIGDAPYPAIDIPYILPDGIQDGLQYLEGEIETSFFRIYNQSHYKNLGMIFGQTITEYLNKFPIDWGASWEEHKNTSSLLDCKMVEEWVLLGDPSLVIK